MIVNKLNDMKVALEATIVDAQKAENGNKAAATRVRATMAAIAKATKEVRAEALKARNKA